MGMMLYKKWISFDLPHIGGKINMEVLEQVVLK
jgi:hypothetical protein